MSLMLRKSVSIVTAGLLASLAGFVNMDARAGEWDVAGSVAAETRTFPGSRSFQGQDDSVLSPSLVLEPEIVYQWNQGNDRLTFRPFWRLDADDPERTHGDIREANWLRLGKGWDVQVGVGKVFWGVTESIHLVDIINQTDNVEDTDGEDKLGQPLINLNLENDWGMLELFVLPGFRERTFPGSRARLRGPNPVDTDNSTFDSGSEEYHVDFAARWSRVFGDLDLGLSHFNGTSREPRLIPANDGGRTVFRPHYDLIDQTGLDLQYTVDGWLWKLEAMTRSGHGDRFGAGVAGVEYTFYQIGGNADLGLLAEYAYDGRDASRAPAVASDDDVFVGLRLALNDEKDTTALLGAFVDRVTGETFVSVEAERRLNDYWKMELEGRLSPYVPKDGFAYGTRNDDFVTLRLTRYF